MAEDEVTLLLAGPDVSPLASGKYSLLLRIELAEIGLCDGVVEETICVHADDHYTFVSFDLEFGVPSKTILQLRRPEPIVLRYRTETIGRVVPSLHSNRADFPRELPHLNPIRRTKPVSFCIARNGSQAIYDGGRIPAVLLTLQEWLRHAAGGTLDHDGWEPYPRSTDFLGAFNAATFQEMAHEIARTGNGVAGGLAWLLRRKETSKAVYAVLDPERKWPWDLAGRHPFEVASDDDIFTFRRVPWVLVALKRNKPDKRYRPINIRTGIELMEELKDLGLHKSFTSVMSQTLKTRPDALKNGLIVIAAISRPKPLIADIPGLSQGDPRRYELLPFLLHWNDDDHSGKVSRAVVTSITHVAESEPALLSMMSGLEPKGDGISLLGCGALGGQLAEFLVRSGCGDIRLVDYDVFQPHNVARHVLTDKDSGANKAKALAKRLDAFVTLKSRPIATGFDVDIVNDDSAKVRECLGEPPRILINATAERSVEQYLVSSGASSMFPVFSVEIAHAGQLGFVFAQMPMGTTQIDDLRAELLNLSLEEERLSAWLTGSDLSGVVPVGVGCGSNTLQMPMSTVSYHASNFHAVIRRIEASDRPASGVGMSFLSAEGLGDGFAWFDVDDYRELRIKGSDWTIRVSEAGIALLHEWRKADLPVETGGYLFGRCAPETRTITLSIVGPPPTNRLGTETSLELPPVQQTDFGRKVNRRTGGAAVVYGSWHSHPSDDAEQSGHDRKTLSSVAQTNEKLGRPSVMLIVADDVIRAFVHLPKNWSA